MTPPLPDRIAAAIDAYAQKSVACGSRYETGPIAARTTACALIAEVVAERDALRSERDAALLVLPAGCGSLADAADTLRQERDAALADTSLPGYCRLVKERDAARRDLVSLMAAAKSLTDDPNACWEDFLAAVDAIARAQSGQTAQRDDDGTASGGGS